ncbi:MAG: apolipoprotein N-acyltransferase [Caulobacterales bacterium]|nr:apolipoprotein N-acyltransferase [Caulobacterales bacterium]
MNPATAAAAEREGPLAVWRDRVMALRWAGAGLAAAALGAVGALAFAPLHAWPAAIVAYTGFIWLMDGAEIQKSQWRAGVWRGLCFGFGHHLAGLWWVANAFVSRGPEFAPFAPLGAIGLALGLALFWAVIGGLLASYWRDDWRRIALFAAIVAVVEFARGNILTGFPWNLPAHVWPAGGPVSQSVSVFGGYGLSFLTLFAFAAPAALGGPDRRLGARLTPLAIGLGVFAALFAAGALRLAAAGPPGDEAAEPAVRLRLVQAQIRQADKWRPENREAVQNHYLDLTRRPGLESRTHVIWPEAALPVLLLEEPRVLDAIAATLDDGQSLFTGAVRRDVSNPLEPLFFNSFVALEMRGATPIVAAIYDKHRLVPFGEFVPLARWSARLGLTHLSRLERGYEPGPGPATVSTLGAPSFSPQVCYESIFPGFTPRGADRPHWILNITNDAWYGDSPGPRQSYNQARFRALEEGMPLVRAASGGVSAVIDAHGRVVSRLEIHADDVLDVDLPGAPPATLYALVGEAGFVFLLFLGFGMAWRRR